MTLTDLGRQYYEDTEAAVQAIKDASNKLARSETDLVYRIRLLASPYVGTEVLPELLVPFHAAHPNVLVDVELSLSPPSLTGRGFDLAIWGGPLPSSNLVQVSLQNEGFGLFAVPAYLASTDAPKTPEDLVDHSCILMRPEGKSPHWDLRGPDGTVKITPPPTFTGNDVVFLRNLVLQGGGIGPLPIVMARRWQASGALTRVLCDYILPGLPLHLLFPNRAYTTRPVENLKLAIKDWSKHLELPVLQIFGTSHSPRSDE